MTKSVPNEVNAAFELLLEQIESVVEGYVDASECALRNRDFDLARKLLGRIEVVTQYRKKVDGIRREWGQLEAVPLPQKPVLQRTGREAMEKLSRGVRTREEAFYQPILEALVELGGSGKTADVLDRIGVKMQGLLKDVDYQELNSQDEARWRNTAKWSRNELVQDGRMSRHSPHGLWEITEKGRDWIRARQAGAELFNSMQDSGRRPGIYPAPSH